jgi:hypothetical protein
VVFESVVSFVVPVLVSDIQVEEATWSVLKHDVQLEEKYTLFSAAEYRLHTLRYIMVKIQNLLLREPIAWLCIKPELAHPRVCVAGHWSGVR